MFSQRGSTCGTDAIYTVFFEADPIRSHFETLLVRDPRTMMASKDDLEIAMGYAIQRRKKMLSLPTLPEPPKIKRCNSLNTGEGEEMRLRSTFGRVDGGVTYETVVSLLNDVLVSNHLEVLPPSLHVKIAHMRIPEDISIAKGIKADTVFAIVLGIDYYMRPLPSNNSNNNLENFIEKYRYGSGANDGSDLRRCAGGHEVAFAKRDGDWYFIDNTIGWLHKITDADFVPKHVIPALKRGEPIYFLPYDVNVDKLLNYIIMADGVSYGGEPFLLEHDHYKTTDAHVLMAAEAKGGSHRRTAKRRVTRRRKNRKA